MNKSIYELKIVQTERNWFTVRRYPRYDTTVSYQILYYTLEEIEAYIKTAVEKKVFRDLICFMVYEYTLNMLDSTDVKPRILDSEGNEACNIRYKAGDFVEIFNNDEIVLGVVSEIMEDGCTVMTDKRLNSCRHMDFEYLFKPHYKIPVRTEIRLRKAYEHYLAHKMRNIKEIKTKK